MPRASAPSTKQKAAAPNTKATKQATNEAQAEAKPQAPAPASAQQDEEDDSDEDSDEGDSDKDASDEDGSDEDDSDEDASDEEDSDEESSDEASPDESSDDSDQDSPSNNKRKAANDDSTSKKSAKVHATDSPAAPGSSSSSSSTPQETPASANVFVGQLPWKVQDSQLASFFSKVGKVKDARVQRDRQTQKSRGFGYVEFVSARDARKAVETMNGSELDGRKIRVDSAAPAPPKDPNYRQHSAEQRAKTRGDKLSDPSETLFVGGLAFSATEDDVHESFAAVSAVSDVRIPTQSDSGKSKGFAYVQFGSVADATKALKTLNGAQIAGRTIRLDYAPAMKDPSRSTLRGSH